jgi:hypothetical protein
MTIAYDGNAVYITLESFYQERVRGLCGSFDYNQDNDLYLPNCKLTCDTNVFSQAYLINDTKPGASSEENVPEKFDRPKAVCILIIILKTNKIYSLGKILSWNKK